MLMAQSRLPSWMSALLSPRVTSATDDAAPSSSSSWIVSPQQVPSTPRSLQSPESLQSPKSLQSPHIDIISRLSSAAASRPAQARVSNATPADAPVSAAGSSEECAVCRGGASDGGDSTDGASDDDLDEDDFQDDDSSEQRSQQRAGTSSTCSSSSGKLWSKAQFPEGQKAYACWDWNNILAAQAHLTNH